MNVSISPLRCWMSINGSFRHLFTCCLACADAFNVPSSDCCKLWVCPACQTVGLSGHGWPNPQFTAVTMACPPWQCQGPCPWHGHGPCPWHGHGPMAWAMGHGPCPWPGHEPCPWVMPMAMRRGPSQSTGRTQRKQVLEKWTCPISKRISCNAFLSHQVDFPPP